MIRLKTFGEVFTGGVNIKRASEQGRRRKNIPREGNNMHRDTGVRISLKCY